MESYLDDIYLDDIGDVMKYIYVIVQMIGVPGHPEIPPRLRRVLGRFKR